MGYTRGMSGSLQQQSILRPAAGDGVAELLLQRIRIARPYFAFSDIAVEGERLEASAVAEAPSYLERGPMTAAEIGRHAAIAGQCRVALAQRDERKRFFLANSAECTYLANDIPYGSPLRFVATLSSLEKRRASARVTVDSGQEAVASIEVNYTILPQVTFERLFRTRSTPTPPAPNPYAQLLSERFERGSDSVEQRLTVPVEHCVGHFEGYPALPVAVVMGQLSYLAGRLMATPYRVARGSVRARDLCWAGETIRFHARRHASAGNLQQFVCVAETVEEREVGRMDLWLECLPAGTVVN